MRYFAKLGTSNLLNPPTEEFQITKILNGITSFEYVIQNCAINRNILATKLTEDFYISSIEISAPFPWTFPIIFGKELLLTGSIDCDSIEYFSANTANPDRIRLSGFASYVDLAYLLFKRLADADATAAEIENELFGSAAGKYNIGQSETFQAVKIPYSVAGVQNAGTTVVIEYSKGSGVWDTLDCLDESRAFTKVAGTYYLIAPNKPDDWAKDTINAKTKYWVRFRISAGSYSTNPTFGSIYTGDTDILRVQFDNVSAKTILGYVLEGTGYSEDTTDQCPTDLVSMRMEYESRLRCVFGIAKALTWDDGGNKKPYDCWITTDKKVHFKQQRGQGGLDYTTFAEIDPNSHIGLVGTNHIDFDAYSNENCYLYKDFNTDYFGDFKHKVDMFATAIETSGDIGFFWALSNDLNDMKGLQDAQKSYLGLFIGNESGTTVISLREGYGANTYDDFYVGAAATWYYFTITKSGTALTCKIYSDSARTTLLDTLSLTLHADHKFRYLFGCNTYNSGTTNVCTLDIENLTIYTDISPILTMFDNIEGYQGIGNRIYGLGSFDGINQRRAIVENQTSQDAYSLREIFHKDLRFLHEVSLKDLIQKELSNSKAPLKEVSGEIETTFWLDHSLSVGDEVIVHQPAWNVSTQTYRIMRAVIGPLRTRLDLGIQQTHLENIRGLLQNQINIDDIWMKGSGNIYQESSEIFCSASAPSRQRFYISQQMEAINRAYLRYKVEPWTKISDMTVLPDAEKFTPWTKQGTELAGINPAGYLHIVDDSDTDSASYYHEWFVDENRGYVVKTRLQVITSSNESTSIDIAGGDSKTTWILAFHTDRIILYSYSDLSERTYLMNTTDDYHTYMVMVNREDIKVYVDGTLRIDGAGAHSAKGSVRFVPPKIIFGCGAFSIPINDTQGEFRCDYFKYSEHGEKDPDNLTLKVEIGQEGETLTEVDGSPATLDQMKINIVSALRAISKDSFFIVRYTPNQEQYMVFSSIFCETFLYSK